MRERQSIARRALLAIAAALVLGPGAVAYAQTASTTYRGTKLDPFTKYRPPLKRKVEKKVGGLITPPPVQTRIDNYKAQKQAAMSRQQPVPKPTTAFLLGELQVTGIFRTPRGYAAMVEATPINLSYVVYPGEAFYDGMLVAIEETRLVFRRETRWTDGRREVTVETKPLRQYTSVADTLTTTRADASAVPASANANAGAASAAEIPAEAQSGKEAPNAKAVESLSNKVDKLLELLKKQ